MKSRGEIGGKPCGLGTSWQLDVQKKSNRKLRIGRMVGWRNSFVLLAWKIITEVIFATAIALLARRITKAISAMVIALLARTIITDVIFATAIALLAWRITKAISAMAIALLARKIITKAIFATAIALLAQRFITKAIFATAIALLARKIITEVIFATAIALSSNSNSLLSTFISSAIISRGRGKGVVRVAEGNRGEIISTFFQMCHQSLALHSSSP